jgi:hypothetical protein
MKCSTFFKKACYYAKLCCKQVLNLQTAGYIESIKVCDIKVQILFKLFKYIYLLYLYSKYIIISKVISTIAQDFWFVCKFSSIDMYFIHREIVMLKTISIVIFHPLAVLVFYKLRTSDAVDSSYN